MGTLDHLETDTPREPSRVPSRELSVDLHAMAHAAHAAQRDGEMMANMLPQHSEVPVEDQLSRLQRRAGELNSGEYGTEAHWAPQPITVARRMDDSGRDSQSQGLPEAFAEMISFVPESSYVPEGFRSSFAPALMNTGNVRRVKVRVLAEAS